MLESFTFTFLVLDGVGFDTIEDTVVLDTVGLETIKDTVVLDVAGLETTQDTVVLDAVGLETTEDTVAMGVWKLTDEDILFFGVTSDAELEEKLGET